MDCRPPSTPCRTSVSWQAGDAAAAKRIEDDKKIGRVMSAEDVAALATDDKNDDKLLF